MPRPKLDKANHRKKITVGYNDPERADVATAARLARLTRARFIREASLFCAAHINAAEQGNAAPVWPFAGAGPFGPAIAAEQAPAAPTAHGAPPISEEKTQ